MRCSLSLLGAWSALTVLGVAAQGEPAANINCVDTCFNEATTRFPEFECGSATDKACLCQSDSFKNSIRDCSQAACGANPDQVAEKLSTTDTLCAGQTSPEESSEDEEPTEPTEEAGSTEEPQPTEEAQPSSTSVEEQPQSTTASETLEEPTEQVKEEPAEEPSTEPLATPAATTPQPTDAAATDSASATGTSTSATASETVAVQEEEKTEGDGAAAGGLSQGAAVGIGVGVTVSVVAIGVVAFILWLRRRKQNKPPVIPSHNNISRPLPDNGADRAYPSMDQGSWGEKRPTGDSIELTANRYEDMVPRTTPRTMV